MLKFKCKNNVHKLHTYKTVCCLLYLIDTQILPYTDYHLGYFNNFGDTPSIVLINSESHPVLYSIESPALEYVSGTVAPESALVIDLTASTVVTSPSDQNK